MTMAEVMPEWPGWGDVDPAIDGPEVVPAQCSSQWSDENARAEVIEWRSTLKWLNLAMSTMTTRAERIVRLYFGFDGDEPTMKEIAAELGCKQNAVSSSLDNVFRWHGKFRRIASAVLSDRPDRQCRNDLARLIEQSALMRIDEPARVAERQARAAVRAESMKRARIAESMRLRFGIAMYGKAMSTMPRGEVIAYAEQWAHRYGKRWRGNPSCFYLSKWPEVSLSSPMATSCVVMAYAPDGISPLRFRRGIDLSSAA